MRTIVEITVTGDNHTQLLESAEKEIAAYLKVDPEQEGIEDFCDYELKVVPNDDGPQKYVAHVHVRIK